MKKAEKSRTINKAVAVGAYRKPTGKRVASAKPKAPRRPAKEKVVKVRAVQAPEPVEVKLAEIAAPVKRAALVMTPIVPPWGGRPGFYAQVVIKPPDPLLPKQEAWVQVLSGDGRNGIGQVLRVNPEHSTLPKPGDQVRFAGGTGLTPAKYCETLAAHKGS